MKETHMKIGFIGTGVIAEAMITGLFRSDFTVDQVIISARGRTVSDRLVAQFPQVRVCEDNQDIVDAADLVFLCVLPQQGQAVVTPLQFRDGQQVVSVMATITAETLQSWIATPVQITRAIPLPSVADQRGVTAIYPPSPLVANFFGVMGQVVSAETIDAFDAYAVASATMATYFGILEGIVGWMQHQGNDPQSAKRYMDTLFAGLAATSLGAPGQSAEALRHGHATPGGLNEQVFATFDAKGGMRALTDGLDAAATRVRRARAPAD